MNANTSSSELVHRAYRLLKQDTDYDKMDLFLRANVAVYEGSDSFRKRQDALATIVDELRKRTPNPKSQRAIKVWLTQDKMAEMFQTSKQNISQHVKTIYDAGELEPAATVKKFLTVRQEGSE
jgi:hypothetical protein